MAVDAEEHMFSPSLYRVCGLNFIRRIFVINNELPFALYYGHSKKKKNRLFRRSLSLCFHTKNMEATMSQNTNNTDNINTTNITNIDTTDTDTTTTTVKAQRPKKASNSKGVKKGVKRPLRRLDAVKLNTLSKEFTRRLDSHKLSVVRLENLVKRYSDEIAHRVKAGEFELDQERAESSMDVVEEGCASGVPGGDEM